MSERKFSPRVSEQLGSYVYRLIDPRNGETFYVGKGKGNRVFAHSLAALDCDEEEPGDKLSRIRNILASGFEVAHVIHRHGMDDKTASEVEAALIDAYAGLTNAVVGAGSSDVGVMHAKEVIARYEASPAVFKHKAVLITVNHSFAEMTLYEATRHAWKISPKKASRADVVLSVRRGVIIGAFVAEEWLPATEENFPGREPAPGRHGFVGRDAPAKISKLYLQRRIPDNLRKRGASNPIRYTYR